MYLLQRRQDLIESGAGTQRGGGLLLVGLIVAAEVDRFALDRDEFVDDLLLVRREFLGDRREKLLEPGVLRLRGECLRPIEREIEMAAPVVDAADLARR